jgi:formyltetrahydrofolate hydrolase
VRLIPETFSVSISTGYALRFVSKFEHCLYDLLIRHRLRAALRMLIV